jgi:hypothetical protein
MLHHCEFCDLLEEVHACLPTRLFSFISAKVQAWGPHEVTDIAVTLYHFSNVWFWHLPNNICIISHMFFKSV